MLNYYGFMLLILIDLDLLYICAMPKHSQKKIVVTWSALASPVIDTPIEQKKISVAALVRSAYILQEITGNVNIDQSYGRNALALSKGEFTRTPRSRHDGGPRPPPSPSSAGRSER